LIVLGDSVGYGPNPRECLDLAASVAEVLLVGNHEQDLVEPDPYMAVDIALRDWTARELEGSAAWDRIRAAAAERGCEALAHVAAHGAELVHGSAKHPTTQYIWPAHKCQYLVFNDQIDLRLQEFLDEFTAVHGFCGHTHVPCLLTRYEHHGLFDPYR